MRGERSGDAGHGPEAVLLVLLLVSLLMLLVSRTLMNPDSAFQGGRVILGIQKALGSSMDYLKEGVGSLRQFREMREQYESALEKLNDYQGLQRDMVELRRENAELKNLLGFASEMEYESIPAVVIGGDPSNLFSTMTINVGTRHHVRVGMPVTAFQDGFFGLLGKVVKVGTSTSQVRPLADPDQYVAARLQQGRFEGLVQGMANGDLLMKYVRKSFSNQIAINELVVTSGMQSIYPAGIYIGRVREVRSNEYSASLNLVLSPVVDAERTEYVFVLRKSGEP